MSDIDHRAKRRGERDESQSTAQEWYCNSARAWTTFPIYSTTDDSVVSLVSLAKDQTLWISNSCVPFRSWCGACSIPHRAFPFRSGAELEGRTTSQLRHTFPIRADSTHRKLNTSQTTRRNVGVHCSGMVSAIKRELGAHSAGVQILPPRK